MSLSSEFSEGLNYIATFKSVTYSTDSFGQETKTKTTLYESVKCNIKRKQSTPLKSNAGSQEDFSDKIIFFVDSGYNGAERGNEIESEGEKYLIEKKLQRRDFDGIIHHIEYVCIEML